MLTVLAAISVITMGAVPDDGGDDTRALRAAVALAHQSGDHVVVPRGEYLLGPLGSEFYAAELDGVTLECEPGAVLRLRPGVGPAVRLLYMTGDHPAIEGCTLEGSRSAQTASAQRHGVFAHDATGPRLVRVVARDFTGDGLYLYHGVVGAVVDQVEATGNARNGITFGAMVTGATLRRSRFVGNAKQQVDSEPGGAEVVSGIVVEDCELDPAGASQDLALTISGTATAQGGGWVIRRNQIRGDVYVVWADDVLIVGNEIDNGSVRPAIRVQRSSRAVRIAGNDITERQQLLPDVPAVWIEGTAGSGPSDVVVAGNRIDVTSLLGYGVRADGAVDVDVAWNRIAGAAAAVRLRATVEARPFERASVVGNWMSGYGRAAVEVAGNGSAKLVKLEVLRNVMAGPGLDLVMAPGVVQSPTVSDNRAAP